MASVREVVRAMGLQYVAELARRGRLQEAAQELARLAGELENDPEGLHLQAQVAAQEGRLHEAQGLWLRASEMEPENQLYRKALDRVEKDLALPRPLRRILPILTPALTVLILLLALYLGAQYLNGMASHIDDVTGQVSTLEAGLGRQQGTAQALATELTASMSASTGAIQESVGTSISDESARQESRLQAIEKTQEAILDEMAPSVPSSIGLTTPGIQQIPGESELVLVFEEGLFLEGLSLRPGVMELLTQLGQELAPWGDRMTFLVVGYTSSDECQDCGNIPLAVQRATRVVEILTSQQAGLPEGDVVIGLESQRPPPFPETIDADRLRNRTAVIVLVPAYP